MFVRDIFSVAVLDMTPPDLERIGKRMYGRKHWRAKLALNLGLDNSTIWRMSVGKMAITPLVEVALRGLDERHKLLRSAEKANNEMLRQQGKLRPRLKRKKQDVG